MDPFNNSSFDQKSKVPSRQVFQRINHETAAAATAAATAAAASMMSRTSFVTVVVVVLLALHNFSYGTAFSLQRQSVVSVTRQSVVSVRVAVTQMQQQQQQQQQSLLSVKSVSMMQLYSGTSNDDQSLLDRNTVSNVVSAVSIVAVVALALSATPAFAIDATATSEVINRFTSTGFYQAFSLVFISEIGDKTFFMAGLLAMKTSKLTSFIGSMSALAVMTVISVLLGQVFHIVPTISNLGGIPLDDIAAVLAFTFFGLKTLQDALAMPDEVTDDVISVMNEELEDAKETVASADKTLVTSQKLAQLGSIFGLVFAAEFGDRSFLSTIALSAAQNPVAVAGGAIMAHGIATGIAVTSGSVVAKYLSEKVIGIIGGTLFLVFAITTAFGIF